MFETRLSKLITQIKGAHANFNNIYSHNFTLIRRAFCYRVALLRQITYKTSNCNQNKLNPKN